MTPKNLIVIMSDEHDARHMGASGSRHVRTPNLDRLARNSLRFASTYTPSPICVPARAAFATGDYVHRIGYWDNAFPYDGRIPSWGSILQQAGIRVESIGKLHYRNADLPTGFDRQHQPMHVANGHGMIWGSVRDPLPKLPFNNRMLGQVIGPGESNYTRYDRTIADRTINWLEDAAAQRNGEPWTLFVGFVAPHFPLIAPQEFFDLYPLHSIPPIKLRPAGGYQRHPWIEALDAHWPHDDSFVDEEERVRAVATYFALCSFLDANVGRILDTLQRAGLSETTRVIYTSDHGDNLGARGLWGKSTLYHESTLVPLVISGPDISPGVVQTPTSLLDLFPTILEASGLDPADHNDRPGRSLFSMRAGADDRDRVVFSEYHAVGAVSGAFLVRKGRWKYHHYVGLRPELFDLSQDPEETIDLAADPRHAGVIDEMQRELFAICDPIAVDRAAKAAQAALIDQFGGRESALQFGVAGATPAPQRPPANRSATR
jgi:choline-sulfatase